MTDVTSDAAPAPIENGKAEVPKEVAKPKPKRRAVYTIDRQEMLEEVGITQKMLRDWTERGLFAPELEKGARRFTKADVIRLRYIKHLRQDLGISIEGVERLLSEFALTKLELLQSPRGRSSKLPFPVRPLEAYPFIDVTSGVLLSRNATLHDLIQRDLDEPDAENQMLEEWLIVLAATAFNEIKRRHIGNRRALETARNDLLERLKEADLAARLELFEQEGGWSEFTEEYDLVQVPGFMPQLVNDPEHPDAELTARLMELKDKIHEPSYLGSL